MPISVRYKNQTDQECVLRPTPLVSINTNTVKVGDETIGVTYDITLTEIGIYLPLIAKLN